MDVDGDANLDLIGFEDDNLRWLEWDGTTLSSNSTGVFSAQAAFHDVDSDGDIDIPYLRYTGGSSFGSGKLFYAKNDGSGIFTDTLIATFPGVFTNKVNTTASVFKKADLDTDGDMDYVVAVYGQNKVVWLRNDSTTFTAVTFGTTMGAPNQLEIHDFDTDGDNDLIVNSFFDSEVILFTNDGTSQFTASVISDGITLADVMHSADVDKDGDLDLVLASRQQDTYLWLKNNAINCPRTFTRTNDTLCAGDSLLVNGSYLIPPFSFMDTLSSAQGCDSINIFSATTFAANTTTTQQNSICKGDSVFFGNAYLSIPGVYSDTLPGQNGCDSINYLQLAYFILPNLSIQRDTNDLFVNATFSNYQWYLNNIVLSGETNDSLNGAVYGDGLYYVTFSDNNGCSTSTDTLNFTVDDVSLPEFSDDFIQLYPNPSKNIAHMRLGISVQQLEHLQLYTLKGKSVSPNHWGYKIDNTLVLLNLSRLPKGTYLLGVTLNGVELFKKVVLL